MRFSLLGSGSKGNALLVSSPGARILVDNGFSFKRLQERVAQARSTLEGLDAVFVTHEHGDHVGGLGVLSRKVDVPIYLTEATYESLPTSVGALRRVELFEAGDRVTVGDMTLASFTVSHDAIDPVGYAITSGRAKLGLATDLGHVPHLVKKRLEGSHALIIEANHCPRMLRDGPYPVALQQRIRSKHGHLSNSDMSSLLAHLMHDKLHTVILAHVSDENNSRRQAHDMARAVLKDHPAQLLVARQDQPTRLVELDP